MSRELLELMGVSLRLGDCIDVMRGMPDASVDSIVTDPPYELSNDGKASAALVFLELMLPKDAKVNADPASGCHLSFLIEQVLALGGVGVEPTPSATVEVSAVAFNDESTRRNQDVENMGECSVAGPHRNGLPDVEPEAAQHLGCFILECADTTPLLDALNRSGCGFLSGAIGVGLRVPAASLPSLVRGCGAVDVGNEVVGFFDDSLAIRISAACGTEHSPMACIAMGWRANDDLPAAAALVLLATLKAGTAKAIRAFPAASGLPAKLQSRRVSVIGGSAGRALTFDLVVHPTSVAASGFMGKDWDGTKVAYNVEMWAEALRVLKPGGHMLAFSGTRTYHRMVCAIEDAGFEVRDQMAWVYGSGFPKSLDVSKAIDKAAGAERTERMKPKAGHENFVGRDNLKGLRDGGTVGSAEGGYARPWMNDPEKVENSHWDFAPATDAARQWQGWGTALKPAWEPICVARKPLIGTVSENVLTHGTGAMNIDGCRVGTDVVSTHSRGSNGAFPKRPGETSAEESGRKQDQREGLDHSERVGRWPANIIHDGSDEVLAAFPQAPGQMADVSTTAPSPKTSNVYGNMRREGEPGMRRLDTGSAARFYYCAKASKSDRGDGNVHPTVKPTDLMRYLCRLVTPPGGVVLDPFMGSGSTGKAAILEGFQFIGIDMTPEYVAIAEARCLGALK